MDGRSWLFGASCLAVIGAALVAGAPASGAGVQGAKLAACSPDKGAIGGVKPCGKVWKLGSGDATIGQDGTVTVTLHGLVLDDASVGKFNGTPDGVDAVAVAVACGGGGVAGPSEPVALSHEGDATVTVKLALPPSCEAPRVLVRERYEGKIGGWLAATGP